MLHEAIVLSLIEKLSYLKAQKKFDKQVSKTRKVFIRKKAKQDDFLFEMAKKSRSFWRKPDAIGIHHEWKKKMHERILD